MHNSNVKNLRFGCGASLQSDFICGHAEGAKAHAMLMDKKSKAKGASNKNRVRGRKK